LPKILPYNLHEEGIIGLTLWLLPTVENDTDKTSVTNSLPWLFEEECSFTSGQILYAVNSGQSILSVPLSKTEGGGAEFLPFSRYS
jgi:hypothetical protein